MVTNSRHAITLKDTFVLYAFRNRTPSTLEISARTRSAQHRHYTSVWAGKAQ